MTEAVVNQIRAADPDASTWVTANAGSGKTRVLTDRVARLLLRGTPPRNILCLTYTKAAASEMQNRLFARLGGWAMAGDEPLRAALAELGEDVGSDPRALARVRTLFAQAIETPGGLRIQTIHSFCASVLRRFPAEAGVSPQFVEMDDRAALQLRREVLEAMATGPDAGFLAELALARPGGDVAELIPRILDHRDEFPRPPGREAALAGVGVGGVAAPEETLREIFADDPRGLIAACLPILEAHWPPGKSRDEKLDTLRRLPMALDDFDAFETLCAALLTRKGARDKRGFATGAAREALGPLWERLDRLIDRLVDAVTAQRLREVVEGTEALHGFAARFLEAYEAHKARRGWLDFDDLIDKTRILLESSENAAWVLFKLDGEIDHVLIDEAQDTSPRQWDVVQRLVDEFGAGASARDDVRRTVFVVGDRKQSIYSFQGADPRRFDAVRARLDAQLAPAGGLQAGELGHSFRSSRAILEVVDAVVAGSSMVGEARHEAFHGDLPGRVDLWPLVEADDKPETPPWWEPVDLRRASDPNLRLAAEIADEIAGMIARAETIPEKRDGKLTRRPVTPGDILILLQRRNALFFEIIRACKARGLDVAGSDRLRISEELAVKDLLSLLKFLALPEDDLSLAEALRSPLFGLSEEELFALAHPRSGTLWAALRDDPRHVEAAYTLRALLDEVDFRRPFELLESTLTRHRGREKLLARLGPEAEDAIDELLEQALAYERAEAPSLTGFLSWLETGDIEVKRPAPSAGSLLRVMTVHGAKGLEAPVVILPDTMREAPRSGSGVVTGRAGVPILVPGKDEQPEAVAEAVEATKLREAEERERLLYVAMTRAETWLIVCGAGKASQADGRWYGAVETAMLSLGPARIEAPRPLLRHAHGDWDAGAPAAPQRAESASRALPDWALRPAAAPRRDPPPLSPSALGGAKALPGPDGDDTEEAMIRGDAVHRLLEALPQATAEPGAVAEALLPGLDPESRAACLAEAVSTLAHPEIAPFFAPGALWEVPVSAPVEAFGGRRILGAIDRLRVTDEAVEAIDFKTNRTVPQRPQDVPDGLIFQMAAYGAALGQIFPGRTLRLGIVWTRVPRLMWLPHDIVRLPDPPPTTS